MIKNKVSVFLFILFSTILFSHQAEAQLFNSNSSCGALGYACINGRQCTNQRCTPAWQDISTTDAPPGLIGHNVKALDSNIIVINGCESTANPEDPPSTYAGVYNPSNDTWDTLAQMTESRFSAQAASTGSDVYVFSGLTTCFAAVNFSDYFETIASVNGNWSTITATDPPSKRYNSSLTWTGTSLFIYGGSDDSYGGLSNGGIYTPLTNSWTSISCGLSSCERGGSYDTWAEGLGGILGIGIRVWGGSTLFGDAPQAITYNFLMDSWNKSWDTPSNGPDFETEISSQRSGDRDIRYIYYLGVTNGVWIFDTIGRTWDYDDTDWPNSLNYNASVAWLSGELFAWSGDGNQYGARYQPAAP